MATLIDTSLWIDFTRARSARAIKRLIAPYVLHPDAHLAEPITFEMLRHATVVEARHLAQQFQTLPTLATPPLLWTRAAELGQACRRKNIAVGSLDLLIAAIALYHGAEVVTFDGDYSKDRRRLQSARKTPATASAMNESATRAVLIDTAWRSAG